MPRSRLGWRAAELALLLALLLTTGALRLHDYDRVPYPNETSDEYAYIWSGWSFLHERIPTAWSQKAAYSGAPSYLWNQDRYTLVRPWLDHPPLYGLIVGAVAGLNGATEMFDASLADARLLSVALGTLAVGLLYLLARRAYGQAVAALAALLFATVPTIVLSSRLALAESLTVVLMLGALLAAQSHAAGQRKRADTNVDAQDEQDQRIPDDGPGLESQGPAHATGQVQRSAPTKWSSPAGLFGSAASGPEVVTRLSTANDSVGVASLGRPDPAQAQGSPATQAETTSATFIVERPTDRTVTAKLGQDGRLRRLAAELASPWLLLAMALSAAAALAKVPGLLVGVSVALYLASERRWVAAAATALGGLLGLALYVAYGLHVNRALFLAVLTDQGSRATGIDVLPRLLTGAAIPPVAQPDSWLIFLWLALAYATYRRDRLLGLATLPYIVFLVATGEIAAPRVWYREPLYPYLCLAGAVFLRDTFVRPDPLRVGILVFGVAFGKLAEAFGAWDLLAKAPGGQRVYPMLVAVLAIPLVAGLIWHNRTTRRVLVGLAAVALAVSVAGSASYVVRAAELYPPYRLPSSHDYWLPTSAGLVMTRGSVEPQTASPGGWLRVQSDWSLERDVAGLDARLYVRSFDRKSGAKGEVVRLGDPVKLAGRAIDRVSTEVSGILPDAIGEGDYEVGTLLGDETVALGVIRVRASLATDPLQGAGLATKLGDVATLGRTLIGEPRPVAGGTAYPLLVSVEAERPSAVGYHLFVHLADEDGNQVAQIDWLPDWRVGESVGSWREIVVPSDAKPGRYYLTAGLYDMVTKQRQRSASGADTVPLGTIEVGTATQANAMQAVGAKLAGGIELAGYTLDVSDAGNLGVRLFWKASGPILRDYTVFVHVVDASGKLVAQHDGPPDLGRLPTSTWRADQLVSDVHPIQVKGLPAGSYRVLVGLYLPPDGQRLAVSGREDGLVELATIQLR